VPLIFSHVPSAHVVVVDDNSPDGTSEVVEVLQQKYPLLKLIKREHKEGLGRAYLHAFREVLEKRDSDAIVMMDADFSHNPEYLPAMLAKVRGNEVVIGSRYVKGGKIIGWELWRRVLSMAGNFYCRVITGMPIRDCTGGFNAIDAKILSRLDFNELDLSGYAFIMGLKNALYSVGAIFIEIPITFVNRVEGDSKLSNNIIQEGIIAPWKMRFKK
jgi:dolichol-phosphate mannosyltransferase